MIEQLFEEKFAFVERILTRTDWRESEFAEHTNSSYPWGALPDLEKSRQVGLQNETGWGRNHFNFVLKLKEKFGLNPRRTGEIGVSWDGTCVIHQLDIFPNSKVYAFELDKETLEGAEEAIRASRPQAFQSFRQRVLLEPGDATVTLAKLTEEEEIEFMVDQLGLLHMPEEERRPLVSVVADKLKLGGMFVVCDILPGYWRSEVAPGFENDPEAQKIVERDNVYLQGNIQQGGKLRGAVWSAWESRGVKPWKSPEHIVRAIESYSGERLKAIQDEDARMIDPSPLFPYRSPEAVLAAHIPPQIALCADRALWGKEEELKAKKNLWAGMRDGSERRLLGEQIERDSVMLEMMGRNVAWLYPEGLYYAYTKWYEPRVMTRLPTMIRQAFQKVA